jgi:HNH endonuclease
MAYSNETLSAIYDKTNGCCRYCEKQLAFSNYGLAGARGSWQVDHSRSRANGGTSHRNKLYASCVSCNLEKGALNGSSYLRPIRTQQRDDSMGDVLAIGGALLLAYLLWKNRPEQPPAPVQPWSAVDPFSPPRWP